MSASFGWVLWAALSLAHGWAGWCWSAEHLPTSTSLERVLGTTVFGLAGLLGVALACAAFGVFAPGWLTAGSVAWLTLSVVATARARPAARLLSDLSRAAAMKAERFSLAWLTLPLAVTALGATCVLVVWFRTWNYDATVYHAPIAYLFVHHGSLHWPELHNVWIEGYPFDVSLLSAWNIVFTRDKVLDDAAQVPFVVMACLALASWCRFAGAGRVTSLALGSAFLLLPPVWLQSMHSQVDIACAALFLAATRQLVSPVTRGRFLVVACALGLYVGSKFTGVLHLVALLPWLAWWAYPLRAWALTRGGVLVVGLGGARYLVNALAHGSPFWPFMMKVPLLGMLPGPVDPGPINLSTSGSSGAFFSAQNSIPYILWSWFHDDAMLWPDVRSGGFGPVFRWLLLPCLGLLAWDVVRRRSNVRRAVPILLVFVLALVVPMPWWPRYTLAAGGMGLVAFASALGPIPAARRAQALVAALFLALVGVGWLSMGTHFARNLAAYRWPVFLEEASLSSQVERERHQVTDWLWPPSAILARDERFADGGVLLYDESGDFLSEYFARGLRSSPRFASTSDPGRFLRTVDELRPCWLIITRGTLLEQQLRARGMTAVFDPPRTSTRAFDTHLCR